MKKCILVLFFVAITNMVMSQQRLSEAGISEKNYSVFFDSLSCENNILITSLVLDSWGGGVVLLLAKNNDKWYFYKWQPYNVKDVYLIKISDYYKYPIPARFNIDSIFTPSRLNRFLETNQVQLDSTAQPCADKEKLRVFDGGPIFIEIKKGKKKNRLYYEEASTVLQWCGENETIRFFYEFYKSCLNIRNYTQTIKTPSVAELKSQ